MTFFSDIRFFVCLLIAIVPAAILGFNQKRTAVYGFFLSCFFLAALFINSVSELKHFLFFLTLQTALAFLFFKWRKNKKSQPLFYTMVALSLFPLVAYKIGAVFDANILGFMGISYITFRSLQVIIEIHDGLITEFHLFDYLYFLLFFAPFTSGPIDRSRRFITDIKKAPPRNEYADLLSKGLMYILLGAVYEFVLGAIFIKWNAELILPANLLLKLPLWIFKNIYCYGFYLFFNFAGYSLMAVGTSYCLGIKTPMNFNKPFLSVDIKEFWNRWHITLSHWLRDFVFTRFVMTSARHKWFKSRLTTANIAYFLNMTIMGFWHGLTLHYIVYGIYHGLLLALTDTFEKKSKFYKKYKNHRLFKLASWFITFQLVMFGFYIFSGKLF